MHTHTARIALGRPSITDEEVAPCGVADRRRVEGGRGGSVGRRDPPEARHRSHTYFTWKSKYGSASVKDLTRLQELKQEDAKLKRVYARTRAGERSDLGSACPEVVTPSAKREAVGFLTAQHGLSVQPARVSRGQTVAGGLLTASTTSRGCGSRRGGCPSGGGDDKAAMGLLEVP